MFEYYDLHTGYYAAVDTATSNADKSVAVWIGSEATGWEEASEPLGTRDQTHRTEILGEQLPTSLRAERPRPEKELITLFTAATFRPGDILTFLSCEAIKAAQVRLLRQQKAASKAGSSKSKKKAATARANGKAGGRPREPS